MSKNCRKVGFTLPLTVFCDDISILTRTFISWSQIAITTGQKADVCALSFILSRESPTSDYSFHFNKVSFIWNYPTLSSETGGKKRQEKRKDKTRQ